MALRNTVGVARLGDRTITYGLGVGSADLLVLVHGRACWLEVKTPGGQPTPAQTAFLERMRTHGCGAAVVRSVEEAVAAVEACR